MQPYGLPARPGRRRWFDDVDADDADAARVGEQPADRQAAGPQPVGDLSLGRVLLVVRPGHSDHQLQREAGSVEPR